MIMDVRIKDFTIRTKTGTKDLQQVRLAMRLLSRPEPDKLPFLINEVGKNYQSKILNSIGPNTLKSVVANYNADQLLTLRDKVLDCFYCVFLCARFPKVCVYQVSSEIRGELEEACTQYHLKLDNVAIVQLHNFFSV